MPLRISLVCVVTLGSLSLSHANADESTCPHVRAEAGRCSAVSTETAFDQGRSFEEILVLLETKARVRRLVDGYASVMRGLTTSIREVSSAAIARIDLRAGSQMVVEGLASLSVESVERTTAEGFVVPEGVEIVDPATAPTDLPGLAESIPVEVVEPEVTEVEVVRVTKSNGGWWSNEETHVETESTELTTVVEAWPTLPAETRLAILGLVNEVK